MNRVSTARASVRGERYERCLSVMAEADVDALILCDRASVRYACGAARVWTAGAGPALPVCVVLGTGEVHLIGFSQPGRVDGPMVHTHAARWSMDDVVAAIAAIPELRGAVRIGLDAVGPSLHVALSAALPQARLVDGATVMRAARRMKTPAELVLLEHAVAVCTESVTQALSGCEQPLVESLCRGRILAAAARRGADVAAMPGVYVAVDGAAPALHLDVALLLDGYEGGFARSLPLPEGRLPRAGELDARDRREAAWRSILDAWEPASTLSRLRVAASAAGGFTLGDVLSVGLGVEGRIDDTEPLLTGMVISIELSETSGRHPRREMAALTPVGARLLSPPPGMIPA